MATCKWAIYHLLACCEGGEMIAVKFQRSRHYVADSLIEKFSQLVNENESE